LYLNIYTVLLSCSC